MLSLTFSLTPCRALDQPGWLALRAALWPHCAEAEHRAEMAALLADPTRHAQWLACTTTGEAAGLVEATLRRDYVNGTEHSPVAFIEGLYVAPRHRRLGCARQLVAAVTHWAEAHGCLELASDTLLDNQLGQCVHRALGFEETERVVFFRKSLALK